MKNSTATTSRPARPMPTTAIDALGHLVTYHGWEPAPVEASMVQAHRYAHGIDGRPDLADAHLNHTHEAPSSWRTPAIGPDGAAPQSRRPLTWVILGWNILMGAWILYGLFSTGSQYDNCATDTYQGACEAGTSIGAAIAIGGILFLTAIVDVILGVIWVVTKKDDAR